MSKVNVSIAEDLLRQLDEAAREAHTSRSGLLALAVKHYLEEQEEERLKARRLLAAERITKLAEDIGPWDGTAEILKWRDMH